ncbi:uncharacterized protein LOC143294203 [Babylonia areolata]|uniref:uncharacterized protein LOC143294203 n=1 Tax=Babylonia areolata TaxID=304850 RepID=UPI003FCFF7FC
MSAWMLSYLFYVGIVLPTVVTLALFVFFVICWRKQSARKAVLTKPYDPHGTMRRLGIPNRPPPPPVFLPPPHHNALLCPRLRGGEAGGEDNAAYDMSRSPSAEVQAVGGGREGGGVSLSPMGRPLPPTTLLSHHTGVVPGGEEEIREQLTQRLQATSPCDLSARLALHQHLHHRLDSGLSEPACHSPVAGGGSSGGGESGDRGEGASGGGGGGGGGSRERPQSQNSHTSHSSHSTDSEDSGFRSSRSGGQLAHTSAASQGCTPEPPGLKRSRSAGRGQGQGRGQDQRGAGSSCWPESEGDPPIQLTPTALWPHHLPLHHHHHHPQSSSSPQQPSQSSSQDGAGVKTTGVDPADIRAQLDWRYLQHLAFPGHPTKGRATTPGGCGGDTHRSPVPCQRLTLAHVHSPGERDNPEVLGFSVV